VTARFFPHPVEAFALTRIPRAGSGTGKPGTERSQFRFEVPARIAFPGGRCRKGRCDCFPCITQAFWRDPDEWAAMPYCQF